MKHGYISSTINLSWLKTGGTNFTTKSVLFGQRCISRDYLIELLIIRKDCKINTKPASPFPYPQQVCSNSAGFLLNIKSNAANLMQILRKLR